MPNYTSNYKLTKPLPNELYNIDIQNNNMDIIDTNLKKASDTASESNTRSKKNEIDLEALKSFQEDPFSETGSLVQLDLFQDAPLNVVSDLAPKQKGSGDPYPAGMGKNLLEVTSIDTAWNGITFTVNDDGSIIADGTATNLAYLNNSVVLPAGNYFINGCPAGGDADTGYFVRIVSEPTSGGTSETVGDDIGSGLNFTLTEEKIVTVRIAIRANCNVSKLKFNLMITDASEADKTFAPYTNVRTITGYEALKLTAVGANLAPTHDDITGDAGLTYSISDGKITIAGTATKNVRLDTPNIILPPGQYTLAPNNSVPAPVALYMRKPDGTQFASINMEKSTTAKHTFTLSEPTEACVSLYISSGAALDVTIAIMLNVGTVKAFEPYNGNIYTVQIGQTIYGGKIDWNTGKLISDRALVTLDGTETWAASSTNTSGKSRFYAQNINSGILKPPSTSVVADGLVCSHYKAAPSTTGGTYQCVTSVGIYTSGTMYFYDERYASGTVDKWKAYVAAQHAAGTPIQVVYKLETPTEIQLTPHQLSALAGCNTLYGDGVLTVSGRKDIIWLTHSLIERLEALEAQVAGL